MARTLYFQQVTDSRWTDREDCLVVLQERIEKLKQLLNIDGVEVIVDNPYLIEWGDKEDEDVIKTGCDTHGDHIQYRTEFFIRKNTRKVTWNDIYQLVNSIKAVPYRFI